MSGLSRFSSCGYLRDNGQAQAAGASSDHTPHAGRVTNAQHSGSCDCKAGDRAELCHAEYLCGADESELHTPPNVTNTGHRLTT